jgi:ATP-dependent DNA ligase
MSSKFPVTKNRGMIPQGLHRGKMLGVLPKLEPMRLSRRPEPFDHPDWIFELKLDGFRALACLENVEGRLVSCNGNTFASFRDLAAQVAASFRGTDAVLDGEIV